MTALTGRPARSAGEPGLICVIMAPLWAGTAVALRVCGVSGSTVIPSDACPPLAPPAAGDAKLRGD
jgi:hypothetical protein